MDKEKKKKAVEVELPSGRDELAEALAESLLFEKLLLDASRTPEAMERKGQKSMLSFLK